MFEELKSGIGTQIRLEKKEQFNTLDREISAVMSKAASAGGFLGGNTLYQVTDLCCLAVKSRGQFIWNIIWRFITTAGVSYSSNLRNELISIFDDHFTDVNDLKKYIPSNTSILRPSIPKETMLIYDDSFCKEHKDTIDKIYSEIELFVFSLKKKETNEEKAPTIINFYSPIGAVQTGSGATANVTQNIDTEAKEAIKTVFDMLLMELPEVQEINKKSELIELVEEGKIELSKGKPNSLKIQNTILTVGTMIQATASLQPAYQLLKQGATFLGLSLP